MGCVLYQGTALEQTQHYCKKIGLSSRAKVAAATAVEGPASLSTMQKFWFCFSRAKCASKFERL